MATLKIPSLEYRKKKKLNIGHLLEENKAAILSVAEVEAKTPVGVSRVRTSDEMMITKKDVHSPNIFVKDIKNYFNAKRTVSTLELSKMTENIEKFERRLSNVSPKQRHKWTHLQSRLNFVSLLRRSLRTTRKFGIEPIRRIKKEGEEVQSKGPMKPKVRWVPILPSNKILVFHFWFILMIVVYFTIFFPLKLAFDLEKNGVFFRFWAVFCNAYLSIDIFLRFLIALEIKNKIEDDFRKVMKSQMTKLLLFDILACFPWEFIISFEDFRLTNMFKLPRLLFATRLLLFNKTYLRISRKTVFGHLKSAFSSNKTIMAWKILISIGLFIHYFGCIWISLLSFDHSNWSTK